MIVGEVEWKRRAKNFKPMNTKYLYSVLYEVCPKLLLDLIINSKMIVQDNDEDLIDVPKEVRTNFK